ELASEVHRPSGAEDGDQATGRAGRLLETGAFRDRGGPGTPVEDDQHPAAETEPVKVAVDLGQALHQWIRFALPPHLQFEGLPLQRPRTGRGPVGPADEQVDPATTDPVLAVDIAAAVDNALQIAHEHQLRGDLMVDDP